MIASMTSPRGPGSTIVHGKAPTTASPPMIVTRRLGPIVAARFGTPARRSDSRSNVSLITWA
jgi:hypothetical protein